MAVETILEPGVHPVFHLPEILENIFRFCTAKDLNTCRRVSRMWELKSRAFWVTAAEIKLLSNSHLTKFMCFVVESEAENYEQIFANFVMKKLRLNAFSFFNTSGSYIKNLVLSECEFQNVTSFRRVIFELTPNMESLTLMEVKVANEGTSPITTEQSMEETEISPKQLKLKCLKIGYHYWGQSDLKVSWMDLLCHFPAIETIKTAGVNNCNVGLFKSLSLLRQKHPRLYNVKQINSIGYQRTVNIVPVGFWNAVSDANLPLQNLSVSVNCEESAVALKHILICKAELMEKLELELYDDKTSDRNAYWVYRPIFNCLDVNLEYLTDLVLHIQMFFPVTLFKWTPNLRKLVVDADTNVERIAEQANWVLVEHVKLEKCFHFQCNKAVPLEELDKIINLIPNLFRLKMPMDNDTFSLVCEKWSNLITLDGGISEVDECGFTGMNDEDVYMVNDAKLRLTTVRRANVTYLKSLERLSIGTYPYRAILMGRCGAMYGVQPLRNLRHLRMDGYTLDSHIWNKTCRGINRI